MLKESHYRYFIWRMIPPGVHKYFISIEMKKTFFIYN